MSDPAPQPEPQPQPVVAEVILQEDPATFPADYVKQLRDENASRRVESKEAREIADAAIGFATDLAVKMFASKVLKDPTDLLAYVKAEDLVDERGLPDPTKVQQAAVDLVEKKPHLDARMPEGDIDQGPRGPLPPKELDFAKMLRDAAG